jgi:hypothetical protein
MVPVVPGGNASQYNNSKYESPSDIGVPNTVGILSAWVKFNNPIGDDEFIISTSAVDFLFRRFSTGEVSFSCTHSGGAGVGIRINSGAALSSGVWHHVLMSWDMNTVNSQRVYIDDIHSIDTDIFINGVTLNYDTGTCCLGGASQAMPPPNFPFIGCLAELYVNTAAYLNFDVESNRRLFIDAAGKPVDLGTDGSTPTGASPTYYFPDANPLDNRGSGANDFVEDASSANPVAPVPGPGVC